MKAEEYLKKVGLIQSPFISQERVIEHMELFKDQELKAKIEAISDDNYSERFLQWRNKYFDLKPKIYHYKSKHNKTMHTLEDLHKDFERAMLESPFKQQLLKQ